MSDVTVRKENTTFYNTNYFYFFPKVRITVFPQMSARGAHLNVIVRGEALIRGDVHLKIRFYGWSSFKNWHAMSKHYRQNTRHIYVFP